MVYILKSLWKIISLKKNMNLLNQTVKVRSFSLISQMIDKLICRYGSTQNTEEIKTIRREECTNHSCWWWKRRLKICLSWEVNRFLLFHSIVFIPFSKKEIIKERINQEHASFRREPKIKSLEINENEETDVLSKKDCVTQKTDLFDTDSNSSPISVIPTCTTS